MIVDLAAQDDRMSEGFIGILRETLGASLRCLWAFPQVPDAKTQQLFLDSSGTSLSRAQMKDGSVRRHY